MSDIEPINESTEPITDLSNANEEEVYSFLLGDISTNGSKTQEDFAGGREDTIPLEENPFEDATTQIGDGTCIVCGAPTFRPPGLTKAGHKKRAPRYCDLHSPNAKIQAERPSLAGMESQLKRVQEELADDIKLLAAMMGPWYPVTGFYLYEQADPFTIAVLKLAKNNQRALRILHRAASIAPIYTVAETVAGGAYAIQVDQHKADPHGTVARRLHVDRAYDAVYPNVNEASYDTSNTNNFVSPPFYVPA